MDMQMLRRWSVKILGASLLVVVLLALALSAGLVWLGTDNGRQWLASQGERLVSTENLIVDIGTISSFDSGHISIDRIVLSDPDGSFMIIENLFAGFHLIDLLHGNLTFTRISAETALLERLPDTGETPKDRELSFDIPRIRIAEFDFSEIILPDEITGSAERLSARGKLVLPQDLTKSLISLQIFDLNARDSPELLQLDFAQIHEENRMLLQASARDDGDGPIAGILGISAFEMSLNGDGPPDDWRGYIEINAGEDFLIHNALIIGITRNELSIATSGEWNASDVKTRGETVLLYEKEDGDNIIINFCGSIFSSGLKIQGLDTSVKIAKALKKNMLSVSAEGRWDSICFCDDETEISELANSVFSLSGNLTGTGANFDYFSLKNDIAVITGSAASDYSGNESFFDASLSLPDLGVLLPNLKGKAKAGITLAGSIFPLNLQGKVTLDAKVFDSPWENLAAIIGPSPHAESNVTINENNFVFSEGLIHAGEDLDTVKFSGSAFGEPQADFNFAIDYQDNPLTGRLVFSDNRLSVPFLRFTAGNLTLDGSGSMNIETGNIDAAISARQEPYIHLDSRLAGTTEKINITGKLTGNVGSEYVFDYAGSLSTYRGLTLDLSRLQGRIGNNELRLLEPVSLSPEKMRLDNVRLAFGSGEVTLNAAVSGQSIDTRLTARGLPANLGFLPFGNGGTANLEAAISGPRDNLSGDARLDLVRLELPDAAGQDSYLAGTIQASYAANNLGFSADLHGPADLSLKGSGNLPLTLIPFDIPDNAPLEAKAQATLDLAPLASLAGLEQHRLRGRAALDITIGGLLATPRISGNGSIQGAEYENLETGTLLQNISATLTAQERTLAINNLTASGPGEGNLSGQGTINFATLLNPAFNFQAVIDNLQLANNDQMGITASGQTGIAGNAESALLTGNLQINNAEYYIAALDRSASYSGFTIIEIGAAEGVSVQRAASPYVIALDLVVRARNSIFIRAPQFESEWGANLGISGTVDDPVVSGELNAIRGQIQLLDSQISLSEGRVIFNTPDPANPSLNIRGILKGQDIDANLILTGTASSPELAITSDPPLPEDEILSRALFGQSVGDLSPVQALRLANLAAALTGRNQAGISPISRIRQAIGLDTISLGYEEGGATISIGKYINERVYIAVDQGVAAESTALRAEIDITDDIEIETRLGSTDESSIGINWKRDY